MKNPENPFTLTFGKQPNMLISRLESISTITELFGAELPVSQAVLIEGIRGSGKTVLMTTAAKELAKDDAWIVVNLNSATDLLEDFSGRLEDACRKMPRFLRKGFQVSVAGVGFGINGESSLQNRVGVIAELLSRLKEKNKRVLITIDEVQHDKNMRMFASQFQIFVREDYPVFLIMTGLYEQIHAVQNDPANTFLLRTPKIRLEPLSTFQIRTQYKKIFEIDDEMATYLTALTKGYAFAFQALGAVYWDHRKQMDMEEILELYDAMLDDFVYRKIWEGLTGREKEIILAIGREEARIKDICERTSVPMTSMSRYRDSLIRQGLLQSTGHGVVALALPRFHEIVSAYV